MNTRLVVLSLMMIESEEWKFTSDQVKSFVGSKKTSDEESSSPMRADVKKDVVHRVHKTCFVTVDQCVAAILCPNSTNSGRVTTLLVLGVEGIAKARLVAPLSSKEMSGSALVSRHGRPLR